MRENVAVTYTISLNSQLLAQTPVPSLQLAKTFRANAGPCKKRGPAFLFVLSFIGTALSCPHEHLLTLRLGKLMLVRERVGQIFGGNGLASPGFLRSEIGSTACRVGSWI